MTNEGQGVKNVRIKSHIVPQPDSTFPLVIQPSVIAFERQDSLATLEFTIFNKAADVISPSIVSAPHHLVSIHLPPWIAALDSAKGTMQLTRAGLEASFEKSLTIQLNDEAKSRFTIPIKRTGISRAVLVPGSGGH